MTKSKNQAVQLNKVVVNVKPAANNDVPKVDLRHNNPGRPVNKKSARYKRLAKQRLYAKVNSMFVGGKSFTLGKNQLTDQQYKYKPNNSERYGCILSPIGGHVCNVSYIGRTKVLGYTFVMNKKVNVEINLKQVKFTK